MPADNTSTANILNQKAIQGVEKHFANVDRVTIAGATYTPATLKDTFQAENDANAALDRLRAQMKEQMATTRAARTKARVTRGALKAYILANYGAPAVGMLGDFGMSAPKPTGTKSVESKANAILRSHATRAARHTMGKRKKLAIKGVPTTVVDLAPSEASAPPPAPEPANAAHDAGAAPSHS